LIEPMSEPTPLAAEILDTLVEQHRRFLDFLERRVGSRAEAEEVLQAAFVGSIESADTVRNDESVLAWFHRLLCKALVDRHRRQVAQADPRERFSLDVPDTVEAPELRAAVRTCVSALLGTLKSEYETMLRRIDLAGGGVAGTTTEEGIGAKDASVRLHRARLALRQRVLQTCGTCVEHGCLDCECKRLA
jgi:RNA polymerase sigma-70 factor (ECF subfamily)